MKRLSWRFLNVIIVMITSLLVEIFSKIFFWLPPLRRQMKGRGFWSFYSRLRILKEKNVEQKPVFIFHCSSAGEFEQARSVYENFLKTKNRDLFYIFLIHSVSGIKYIRSRNLDVNYMLSPIDSLWRWMFFFSMLRPKVIVYNRYELWPALLYVAHIFGLQQHLILVSRRDFKWKLSRLFFHWSSFFLDSISLICEEDFAKFRSFVSSKTTLNVLGDTKYDNVLSRKKFFEESQEFNLNQKSNASPNDQVFNFVCGSVWAEDLIWLMEEITKLSEVKLDEWMFIVVPHDVSESNIELFRNIVSRYNLSKMNLDIVPKMGILFEYYDIADACFVGGSIQGRVHNVLEPLVFRKRTIIGTSYENSLEAIHAVEAGVLEVIKDEGSFSSFLSHCVVKDRAKTEFVEKVDRFFVQRSGASQRIVEFLNRNLNLS